MKPPSAFGQLFDAVAQLFAVVFVIIGYAHVVGFWIIFFLGPPVIAGHVLGFLVNLVRQ